MCLASETCPLPVSSPCLSPPPACLLPLPVSSPACLLPLPVSSPCLSPPPACLLPPTILFVPSVEIKEEPEEPQPSNIFLAFSRVFSGSLRVGQELYVLYPRYDPRDGILEEEKEGSALPPNTSRFTVKGLYLLMGRSVVAVDTVPAGNIVGIAGLEDVVIKSATLSSTLACPPFCAMSAVAAPIVRVAIEPVHVVDLPALMSGMKLLNLADPSVEVSVQETGEHVLAATGEVHLQKCLEDLKKEYARVQLNVSEPIVPFRETVVEPPRLDMVNEEISADNERKIATTQLRGDIAAPGR